MRLLRRKRSSKRETLGRPLLWLPLRRISNVVDEAWPVESSNNERCRDRECVDETRRCATGEEDRSGCCRSNAVDAELRADRDPQTRGLRMGEMVAKDRRRRLFPLLGEGKAVVGGRCDAAAPAAADDMDFGLCWGGSGDRRVVK